LLDDPQKRRAMAAAALETARNEHDIAAASARLDRVLRDAAAGLAP
jgi:hypothetical protein